MYDSAVASARRSVRWPLLRLTSRTRFGAKYLWLDLQALAGSLLRRGQTLEFVTYFTARVRRDADGEQRQSDYLDALLISADSDLCPAVRETKSLFPAKRIIAAFPPERQSGELKRVADGYLHIGTDKIRRAQLPGEVVTGAGVVLRRPKHWA